MNRANLRKEFFFASPADVRQVLEAKLGNLLEFTERAEATEYLQSVKYWPARNANEHQRRSRRDSAGRCRRSTQTRTHPEGVASQCPGRPRHHHIQASVPVRNRAQAAFRHKMWFLRPRSVGNRDRMLRDRTWVRQCQISGRVDP